MRKDSILAEIHAIRAAHAKRFNHDLHAICADIMRRQTRHKNLVDLSCQRQRVRRVAESHAVYLTKRSKA